MATPGGRILRGLTKPFARLVSTEATARWLTQALEMIQGLVFLVIAVTVLVCAYLQFTGQTVFLIFEPEQDEFLTPAGAEVFTSIMPGILFLIFAKIVHEIFQQRLDDLQAQGLLERLQQHSSGPVPDFILYLRPFDSTGKAKRRPIGHSEPLELEGQLSKACRNVAPFIALGKSLEFTGAARIQTQDSDWKMNASILMQHARLIIMLPVSNPGTWWELERIIAQKLIHKTVFLNAPRVLISVMPQFKQGKDWKEISELLAGAGLKLPRSALRNGRFIFFGHQSTPMIKKQLKLESPSFLRRLIKSAMRTAQDIEAKKQKSKQAEPIGNRITMLPTEDLTIY